MAEPSRDAPWLRRLKLIGVALPVAFIVVLQLLRPTVIDQFWPREGDLVVSVLTALAALGFGLVMFTFVERGHQVVVEQYTRLVAAEQELTARERTEAILRERERLARELHDGLAQTLGATHLRLRALETGPAGDDPLTRAELVDLGDLCQEAQRDVREAIIGLKESTRTDRSLTENLAACVASFSRRSGIPTVLQPAPDHDPVLPAASEVQVMRVVQEALANVRKHSEADAAVVRISHEPGGTLVEITDDGRGFDRDGLLEPDEHFGLGSMRDRAVAIDGDLTVESAPGCGTRVALLVRHQDRSA